MFLNIRLGKMFCMYCAKCTCSRILGNVSLFAQNLPKLSTSSASRKKLLQSETKRLFPLHLETVLTHWDEILFELSFLFFMSEQFYEAFTKHLCYDRINS